MKTNSTKISISNEDTGQTLISGGNAYRIAVSSEQSNQRYTIIDSIVEPGNGGPYHIHKNEDEVFIITEGVMTFYEDETAISCPPGTIISCPPQSVRAFRNETSERVKMLIMYTPPGVDEMILKGGELRSEKLSDIVVPTGVSIECSTLNQDYDIKVVDKDLPIF